MKASELQILITKLIDKYGDQDIKIYNSLEYSFDDINEILPRRITKDQRGTEDDRKKIFFGIDPYAIGDWEA